MTTAGRGPGAGSLGHPRYRQDRLIATGGMGEVWEATDTVLDRQVALKVLKPEYADDPTFRARFEAEARNAARISHPNVAGLLDYGEHAGATGPERPYLVMELVRGQPLSDLLRGGRVLDPDRAAELVAQAATGLHAAHRLGVVHRDIKPGNLLVTPDGQVKITDFGIARAADSVPLTQTGQVIGTPHYLSPEQAEGREATPQSDVYALGVVLFECLAGERPFTADSSVGVALAHVRDPVPELPATVPQRLRDLTRQALQKDPAARPRDAAAFAASLRGEGPAPTVPVAAAPATRAMTAPPTRVAAAPVLPPDRDDRRDDRRRRGVPWLPLLLLLAALLVGGLVAAALLNDGDDTATDDPTPRRTASEAPSSSAAPTPSETAQETPTETPTETEPATVTVDEDDYLGLDRKDAEDALKELGLKPTVEKVDNDGTQEEDTVASVSPTGEVPEGSEITLGVYDKAAPEPPTESGPTDSGPGGGPGSGGPDGEGPPGQEGG